MFFWKPLFIKRILIFWVLQNKDVPTPSLYKWLTFGRQEDSQEISICFDVRWQPYSSLAGNEWKANRPVGQLGRYQNFGEKFAKDVSPLNHCTTNLERYHFLFKHPKAKTITCIYPYHLSVSSIYPSVKCVHRIKLQHVNGPKLTPTKALLFSDRCHDDQVVMEWLQLHNPSSFMVRMP